MTADIATKGNSQHKISIVLSFFVTNPTKKFLRAVIAHAAR